MSPDHEGESIGTSSRVKDLRTGRTTPLVEQVFKGRLDLVLKRGDVI